MILVFYSLICLMLLVALSFVIIPLLYTKKLEKNFKPAKITALILSIVLPAFAIIGYQYFGSSAQLFHYWDLQNEAVLVKQELAKIKNPEQIIERLQAHLQKNPNSAKGWYLLGRIYLGAKQFTRAYQALQNAFNLQPANLDIATTFTQASFFYHDQHLTRADQARLRAIIEQSPNNVVAINLVAIDAYLSKNYQLAVHYWERLLPLFALDSPDQHQILQMIAMAQKQIMQQNAEKNHGQNR